MNKRRRQLAARRARPRIQDMEIEDFLTIGPRVSADVAWTRMHKRNVRHLLVAEGDRFLGTLSEARLGGSGTGDGARRGRMVEDLMAPRVETIDSGATLRQAINLMREQEVGCLLVEEDSQPVGLVTATSVLEEMGRDPITAPFPGYVPRPEKVDSGAGRPIPAHIRMFGANLSKEQRASIREELGARLGKFGPSIERITIRVDDVNGPRGGVDQMCRVKVVLSEHPSIVFENRAVSLETAVHGALLGVERAVGRTLDRKRMKPIKAGARSTPPQDEE